MKDFDFVVTAKGKFCWKCSEDEYHAYGVTWHPYSKDYVEHWGPWEISKPEWFDDNLIEGS